MTLYSYALYKPCSILFVMTKLSLSISRVERKTVVTQTYFWNPYKGAFDPFVNNANLGAIAHTSNGT